MTTPRTSEARRPALTDLEITDLGIIDRVELQLTSGLNVLTGETGAGKTMVVSALQWLLGSRAEKDKVRSGARSAIVNACIDPAPASAAGWMTSAADDGASHDDPLIISREVGGRATADGTPGRSRARIAGQLAPVASLGEVLGPVVEIHSQHEAMRLADPLVQRRALDRFGGDEVLKARVAYDDAFADWRQAQAALEHAQTTAREGAREADRLRFELGEIDAVTPSSGEEDELDADIARLEHAESLRVGAQAAIDALNQDDAARDALGVAISALRAVADHDAQLVGPLERLEAQLAEVQEVAIDLTGYLDGLDADPAGLDELLGRRAAIGGLLRKYGPSTAEVIAWAAEARERLALIDGGDERIAQLSAAVDTSRQAVDAAGDTLRTARETAAAVLSSTIDAHLSDLSMRDARMIVDVSAAEPTAEGADTIEFLLAANPGQPPLPLSRAASGGERSRVALALRVALADADDTPVLIFDEVDAGIGGETALAVGQKLAALAATRQVICVTHLAQLAAFADTHFVVHKTTADARTTTSVDRLTAAQRPDELARMLSGAAGSDTARSHARELLGQAEAARHGQ